MNRLEIAAGLAPTPGYRYAHRVGAQLFLAGQVPLDAEGRLVGQGDPMLQTRQCLDNLALLLGVHQFLLGDVRHLRVHVVGPRVTLVAAWSAVTDWFGQQVPPATLLGSPQLGHQGQLVEIETTVVATANLDPAQG